MVTINITESQKLNYDQSLFVTFEYDERLVDLMKSYSQRNYNPNTRSWELCYKYLTDLRTKLNMLGCEYQILGKIYETKVEPNKPSQNNIDYEFKTKPYEHQVEGFNYGLNNNKWLLADEQGLGKTKQIIDIAVAKKQINNFQHCLIICGVNSLKWNWQNEIKTHSNESGWVLGQRKLTNGKYSVKSNQTKLEDLKALENDMIDDYFLITNVESLRSKDIVAQLKHLLETNKINMIAVDEIHKCANPSSQQSKGLLQLSNASVKIALTGTPIMNKPIDIFLILKWLGYETHSFYTFKNHYCIMGGFGGYEVMGYKNLDELQDILDTMMLRRLKEDVLDLPDKIYIDECVEMNKDQTKIYNETLTRIRQDIDKIMLSANPLSQLIRLRQATGYTGILSTTITESAKLDRMEELVDDIIANNEKAIIFSNWTQITDVAIKRLQNKYKVLSITGDTNDADRQRIVDTFQNNNQYKVIIGTIGAMGTGITLTAATNVIFLDEPWTMANKQQAIDRCHRIGTKDNIMVYTIMAHNSIDERIHTIVENKGAISDYLIDGKVDIKNAELIQFLLS